MYGVVSALLLAPSIVQACQGPRTTGELARHLWDNPDYDVRTRPSEWLRAQGPSGFEGNPRPGLEHLALDFVIPPEPVQVQFEIQSVQ